MSITVVYIGNFEHRHCTEVHVAAALEALGHTVHRAQEGPPGTHRGMPLHEIERLAVESDADLLLYTRTWGLPDHAAAIAMFRRLEATGVTTASFHLDLYLGLNREATLNGDPFWSTQYVFTPDGDPASAERFEALGIRHVWSPPAVHRAECVMGTPRPEFDHDAVFVGSYPYPHPEWRYRDELVEAVSARYPNFGRYGANGTTVRNEPLNDLYASARAVVGDSLCPGFTKPNYWSDRITETLGRGGRLIWPDIPGCLEFYGLLPGIHLLTYEFGDFDAVFRHIDWLNDPENAGLAADMAANAQAEIREFHTYENRLAAVIEAVGLGA